jgi:phenylacetate-CoA ligase
MGPRHTRIGATADLANLLKCWRLVDPKPALIIACEVRPMPPLNRLYDRAPIPVQNLAVSLAGWWTRRRRLDGRFEAMLARLQEQATLPADDLAALRDARIRAYVRHCAGTVPHWRQWFAAHDLRPDDIGGLADLRALPVLTKAEVRGAREAFRSSEWPDRRGLARGTGGTTGASLRFWASADAVREQWAVWWRFWTSHGIDPGTWCGYFVGIDVVPSRQRRAPFWRVNRPRQQVMFSIFHLSPATLPDYVAELRRRRLPWLHGYPSVLAIVARHVLDTGADLGYRPRWVTTGAENLLPSQVELIEAAFGVRPRQVYGLAEGVANLSECPHGRLHVDEEFAAVEFVENPADPGTRRLIGSNLSNPAFCLLRYDTGDLVTLAADDRCDCGLHGRVVETIDGRREDVIILADGTRLGRLAHIFQGLDCLREAQVVQESAGEITLRIVKAPGFDPRDEAAVLEATRRRVGRDTPITLEYVEDLPREANGKLRFVVSQLTRAQTGAATPAPGEPR